MWTLFLFTAKHNVILMAQYIPGVDNGAAYALSRNNKDYFLMQVAGARRAPTPIPAELLEVLLLQHQDWTSQSWTRLLLASWLKASWSQHTGIPKSPTRFIKFCAEANLTPLPASEEILCLFVAHLHVQHLKYRTIKSYLSAVRFLHIVEGRGNPFEGPLNRLEYVLKGVNREEAAAGCQKWTRLPAF